jgi:ribosomal protein S18 acetylase RimI-like enzyme
MGDFTIRPVTKEDRNWVAQFLDKHWKSTRIVTRGQVYLAHLLPGFIVEQEEECVGLVTYRLDGADCELMTINSLREGEGIGTTLIEAVKAAALEEGCRRIWLITTNDNLPALRFYQKRDFRLVAVYPDALDESRKLKPEIPLFGLYGIPLRDEIELQLVL